MSALNPYREWLGLLDVPGTIDHYRLLGLESRENDPAKIAAAAARRESQLRAFLTGDQRLEAERLLRQIEAARHCLLNPAAKAAYDAQLAGTPAPMAATPPVSTPQAEAPDDLLPPMAVPAGHGQAPPHFPSQPPWVASWPAAPSSQPPAAPPVAYPAPHHAPSPPPVPQALPYGAPPGWPTAPPSPSASPAGYPPGYAGLPVATPAGNGPWPAAPAPAQAAPADSGQPVLDQPILAGGQASSAAASALRWRRKKRSSPALVLGAGAAAVGVIVFALVVFNREDPRQPVPSQPVARQSQPGFPSPAGPGLPAEGARRGPVSADAGKAPGAPVPGEPQMPDLGSDAAASQPPGEAMASRIGEASQPPEAVPTPAPPGAAAAADLREVEEALVAARLALSKRNVTAARSQLERARRGDAGGKRADEIERLEALVHYVEGFWNAVRERIKALSAGEQVTLGQTVAGVVEVDRQKLVLRIAGQNKTYLIDELPAALAYALANDWFDKGDPGRNLFLGAFHLADAQGDRQEARRLWEAAAQQGKQTEAQLLLPELDRPPPSPAAAAPELARAEDGRLRVPEPKVLEAARAEMQAMFEADFAEAEDIAGKLALAEKLLGRADELYDNPVLRYLLLWEASRQAAGAGDIGRSLAAVDKLAEAYEVDLLAGKADVLVDAAKGLTAAEANRSLAAAALDVADLAIVLGEYDQAQRLARVAVAAARKASDGDLLKQSSGREKEIRELKRR